jgi:hypothetical protein
MESNSRKMHTLSESSPPGQFLKDDSSSQGPGLKISKEVFLIVLKKEQRGKDERWYPNGTDSEGHIQLTLSYSLLPKFFHSCYSQQEMFN